VEKLYEKIEKEGVLAKGKKELLAHLDRQILTAKQAIYAKCYDCLGYYADGKNDCAMPNCSLYPFMPYNPNRIKKTKELSDDQREALRQRSKFAFKRSGAVNSTGRGKMTKRAV